MITDEEFINKLNDVFKIHDMELKMGNISNYDFKIGLINLKTDKMLIGFDTIDDMINGNFYLDCEQPFSIFEYIQFEKEHLIPNIYYLNIKSNYILLSDEFIELVLNIKGKTKEEILLKLQMMGY